MVKKVRITAKKKEKETTTTETPVKSKHLAIRCHIHNDIEMLALNEAVFKFNEHYANPDDILMRSGRSVNTSDVEIDIAFAYRISNNNIERYKGYYPIIIDILKSYKIEHELIEFENSYKNIYDVFLDVEVREDGSDTILISLEKSIVGKQFFEDICRSLIPDADPSKIHSIRIPYSSLSYTTDHEWVKIEEPIKTETDKSEDKIVQINVSIFDKKNSDMFDILVDKLGCKCVVDTIADYTENDDDKFFRTIHMNVKDDNIGRIFINTCALYGPTNVLSDTCNN